MMALARGVEKVEITRKGSLVEGLVYTKALTHVAIGIDDTDSREGGATFALALALLQHIGRMDGFFPIAHRVAMLNPHIPEKTAGNSCSFIELAANPELVPDLSEKVFKFIADETHSPEWGVAIKKGFTIPHALRMYGRTARNDIVTREEAGDLAEKYGIIVRGRRGVIGALAAVALAGLPTEILLDIRKEIPLQPD